MTRLQVNIKNFLQNKVFQSIELLVVGLVPTSLILTKVVPFDHKGLLSLLLSTSFVSGFLVFLRIKYGIWKKEEMGITTNIKSFSIKYLKVFIVLIIIFIFAPHIMDTRSSIDFKFITKYSFFGALAQEVTYRLHLTNLLKDIFKDKKIYITVNIFLFTAMHVIFPNLFGWNIIFIVFGGILFSYLYDKYPNIFFIWVIHGFTTYLAYFIKII